MIESFQFVNAADGYSLIFNDLEIPFTSLNMPVDMRNSENDRMQEDGQWPTKTYLGKRLFQAEGDILQQDSLGYIQKRMALYRAVRPSPKLGNKTVGRIYVLFTGMVEPVYSDVTLENLDMPMEALSPSRGKYTISWRAFDPRLYGQNLNKTSTYLSIAVVGGRAYKRAYPKSYSLSAQTTGDTKITNSGNMTSFLTVRIYGEVLSPQLTLTRTDGTKAYWYLDGYYIRPGEYVDIDFHNKSVVASDNSNLYNFAEGSEWWELQPGDNSIRFSATSFVTSTKAEFSWHNAYMI